MNDAQTMPRLHGQLISPALVVVPALTTVSALVSKHLRFSSASPGQYLVPLTLPHQRSLHAMFSRNLLIVIICWSLHHFHSVWYYWFILFIILTKQQWGLKGRKGEHTNSLVTIYVSISKIHLSILVLIEKIWVCINLTYGYNFFLLYNFFYYKNKVPSFNFTWFLKVIHTKISYF